jgi:hypothetical protein
MCPEAPESESPEIAHLRAEARYARERLALYRAKAYGMRETSPVRMRELERNATATSERLTAALRAAETG